MKRSIFALATMLALATSPAATFDWRADNLAPGREAEFRLWLPDKPDATRGIIILVPGRNGDARTWVDDPAWQTLARRRNCALLGCRIVGDYYYIAGGWSGEVLLKAVRELGALSGRTDLKDTKLAFFGHSAGGQFSCSFVDWRTDHVLAFVACKGNLKEWKLDARKRAVPGLWIIGRKDSEMITENMTGSFCEGRRLGAPWVLAVEPEGGHGIGPGRDLAIAFLEAVMADSSEKSPWIGDLRTHEVSPAPTRAPDFRLNAWLPDQAFASAWKNFTSEQSPKQ